MAMTATAEGGRHPFDVSSICRPRRRISLFSTWLPNTRRYTRDVDRGEVAGSLSYIRWERYRRGRLLASPDAFSAATAGLAMSQNSQGEHTVSAAYPGRANEE